MLPLSQPAGRPRYQRNPGASSGEIDFSKVLLLLPASTPCNVRVALEPASRGALPHEISQVVLVLVLQLLHCALPSTAVVQLMAGVSCTSWHMHHESPPWCHHTVALLGDHSSPFVCRAQIRCCCHSVIASLDTGLLTASAHPFCSPVHCNLLHTDCPVTCSDPGVLCRRRQLAAEQWRQVDRVTSAPHH